VLCVVCVLCMCGVCVVVCVYALQWLNVCMCVIERESVCCEYVYYVCVHVLSPLTLVSHCVCVCVCLCFMQIRRHAETQILLKD
jgi:hypothetical protein